MFSRKKLIKLRTKAENEANVEGLNPEWERAYLRLADAADHLDAMIARTEETEPEPEAEIEKEAPQKEIIKYSLSKDRAGLLAWFLEDNYYHIHSDELNVLEKWVHELLLKGD